PERAQRLAASPEKSPARKPNGKYASSVLNASRHHRKNRHSGRLMSCTSPECSTPRGITGKNAGNSFGPHINLNVLDAPRPQRNNRSYLLRGEITPCRCAQRLAASPEKSLAPRTVISQPKSWVLNASRHHRKNRWPVLKAVAFSAACSTPRGITGKIAT